MSYSDSLVMPLAPSIAAAYSCPSLELSPSFGCIKLYYKVTISMPLSNLRFPPLRKGSEGRDCSAYQGGSDVKHMIACLVSVLLWALMACQSTGILRGSSHAQAFQERYVEKPFYT